MARQLLAGRAVGLLAHWGTRITSESPDPLALRILSEGRGRVKHRPGSPTHESSAGRGGPCLGRKAAHRSFGGCGGRLREVKPSSNCQRASVIWTRATSIFESSFSTVSIRTVASSLPTRSAIVSSLNPRVSKAFTSRPCGAIARTSSTRRCLSVSLWFLGSVAISAPHHGVDGLPARRGEAIAGDDTLGAKPASVRKHGRAIFGDVLVEQNACLGT